jgi:ClpP class serine protease
MANWANILNEVREKGGTCDIVRRRHLSELGDYVDRNVVAYYSGWLQKPIKGRSIALTDSDKTGFMNVLHNLDNSKGLDLILHTPGGETAATESLVDYLRSEYGNNIRAIIPQIAMSAGTMIACACKEIIMGTQSSLGPIDPLYMGLPAHGIIEEFEKAKKEIKEDQKNTLVWRPILEKYRPTLIGECKKGIEWAEEMVGEWLKTGMFAEEIDTEEKISTIIKELGDHALTLSHARHLSLLKCKEMKLKVVNLAEDKELEDKVLSVHHAFMITFNQTPAIKIIENHEGDTYAQALKKING